ncbi:MAG: FHA domain-containing protein [Casimicrobiaceae bacterium]
METVVVIDVLAAHDRVRSRHRIERQGETASCTIGRGAAADVVIDDPHIAAVHARVTVDAAGGVSVTDLGSVNGLKMDGRRVHGVIDAPLTGGVLQIGRTRLRVRTAQEVLPAELPDRSNAPQETRQRDFRWFALGFAVTAACLLFSVWTVTVQSRELPTAMVTTFLGLVGVGGVWVVLWALVSRVAFGESRWLRHAAIFFCVLGALEVISLLVDIASGATGIYLPSYVPMLVFGVAAAAALALHLANASPMRRRTAVAIGILIPAITLGAAQWTLTNAQNRSANYIADRNEMVPPALLLRRGEPLEVFVADLGALTAQADAKRAFVEKEDPAPSDDSADE